MVLVLVALCVYVHIRVGVGVGACDGYVGIGVGAGACRGYVVAVGGATTNVDVHCALLVLEMSVWLLMMTDMLPLVMLVLVCVMSMLVILP